jgi:hypothetical protein
MSNALVNILQNKDIMDIALKVSILPTLANKLVCQGFHCFSGNHANGDDLYLNL